MTTSSNEDAVNGLFLEVWSGFVPIEFRLAPRDVCSQSSPQPFFVLASRFAYLPSVAQEAVEYFKDFVFDIPSELWFECNHSGGLKCNIPIGCLFDLFSGWEVEGGGCSVDNSCPLSGLS